jgi:beta-mannosidase
MGRPYLYTIVLLLKDATGKTVHRKSFRYGIRTVALEERELGKGHKTFTFLVNGEPVFAKGANWVPVDAIPGRITAGKYRALVAAAAEAHVNMFRVWGGGVYESEEFFDLCDRFGILVWHDFMYSCGYYPSHDRGFRRNIGRESELAIRRLRNRASLAGWAGNNEIQCMYQGVKKWHPELDMVFHGEDIFEKILPGLIRRLDPDRPYRPGCPYGGYPSDSGIEGDQHTWRFTHVSGHADYLNLWMHTEEETKFLSEFGVLGPMGIETVDKCLPRGKRNTRSAEWHHHSNSYKRGLQSVILRKYFGSVKRWPLKKYILRGQALQAELMRYIFEELRSRKFHCSGALMWSWSDSFGTNGWSLIDYYLKKKPAYHYFRRALTPLAVGWSGYCPQLFPAFKTWREYYAGRPAPLGLLVMNDLRVDRTVEVECRVMTFAGKVLFARTVGLTAPANRTVNALSLEFGDWFKSAGPDRLVVAARLSSGKDLVHENRYFLVPMRDLRLKSATVAWTKRRTAAGEVELRLTADTFVWMAHLASPDGVEPLDNDFDLLPGETKTVRVRTRDAKLYVPGISSLNPGTRAVRRS